MKLIDDGYGDLDMYFEIGDTIDTPNGIITAVLDSIPNPKCVTCLNCYFNNKSICNSILCSPPSRPDHKSIIFKLF